MKYTKQQILNKMKKSLYIISLLVVTLGFSQTTSFKNGEHLKYKLSYSNFLTAGYATMNIKKAKYNSKEVFHIVGKGKTTGMINWFFKVRDNYETFIDKKTLLPYKFIRQIDEGGYKKDREIIFNQKDNEAVVFDKKTKKVKSFKTQKGVQDLLSTLYYMRNKDITNFKVGDEISLPIFLDNEIMNMKLRFLGRETIKTNLGEIKAVKFMPLVASGRIFKEQESVTVWVSDDLNKIPLRIKASLSVGSLRADLKSYKNLKNPIKFK